MKNKLLDIDDNAIHTELHHTICRAAEEFYRLSINIPKALFEVIQHIHGRFDSALYNVYKAANSLDKETKIKSIRLAKQDIFFQYTSLEYLIKTHAITVGGANNVLLVRKDAYSQTCKWYSHVLKR